MPNTHKLLNNRQFSIVIIFVWIISIGMVSYLSLTPLVEFPLVFWSADKVYHALAYLWLSVLPFLGFRRGNWALAGALLMILLGAGLEVFQIFVPGRFFSVVDMMANSFGAALGVLFGRYLKSSSRINLP